MTTATAESTTILDLTKPADVVTVLRALRAGWDIPLATRQAICAQLTSSLDAGMKQLLETEDDVRGRHARQLIKACRLALLADQAGVIDLGIGKNTFPSLRQPKDSTEATSAAGQSLGQNSFQIGRDGACKVC